MGGKTSCDLYTIGHSNDRIERFLELLSATAITLVADVRSVPFSRRYPWFSQSKLAPALEAQGIGYRAFGETLGGRPNDPALFRDGVADYPAVAKTSIFQAGLDAAIAASKGQRLCLMCAEREPLDCHRCLLVARAAAGRGLSVGHILGDASVEPHAATEDRLIVLTRVKPDLFIADRHTTLAEAYRKRAKTVAFGK
jgi:uncharacterized protein (DUF488 family)